MQLQAFLTALEQRIARYDLLCHPYYKAWTAGQLTRDDLREYAADYYHHVAAFPAYLSALHSRLDDGETRRAVLRNLCGEEIDGRPHSELWLDFAEGMGADRDEVRGREPLPEVRELIDGFRRIARKGSTAKLWPPSTPMSRRCRASRRRRPTVLPIAMAADARTCGYFTLHQFADVEHSHVWRELLSAEIASHPDRADAALNAAETAAQSLWRALDGIEARRMAVA